MFKIMIVDDEITIREKIPRLIDFNANGFEVCATAKNGEEAFNLLEKAKPDLIFLDVRMPVLDGIGFLQKLRKSAYKDTMVLILSGYSDFEYAKKAMSLGAKGYLTKPIDEEEAQDFLQEAYVELEKKLSQKTTESIYQQINRLKAIYNGSDVAYNFENAIIFHVVVLFSKQDYENKSPYYSVQESLSTQIESPENYLFLTKGGVYSYFVPKDVCGENYDVFSKEIKNNLLANGIQGVVLIDEELLLKPTKAFRQEFSERLYQMLTSVFYGGNENLKYILKNCQNIDRSIDKEEDLLLSFRENLLKNQKEETFRLLDNMIEKIKNSKINIERVQELNYRIYYILLEILESSTNLKEPNLNPIEWRETPIFITFERWSILQKQQLEHVFEFINQSNKMSNMGVKGELLDYVHKNFKNQISLKQVAEKFFMNSAYLGRVFQKSTKVSFKQYVNKLRIQEAKRLLCQTDKLVYEIATEIGFAESKYFVERFTADTGESPTEYRKNNT